MKTKILALSFSLLLAAIIIPLPAAAAEVQGTPWLAAIGIPDGQLIPKACTDSDAVKANAQACGLNEVFQTIVNFSQIILALTGSAALLMFTYGGVMFIIAAGNQDQISKGKNALQAAVIGIVIVLTAWLIVNFIILALTKGQVGGAGKIFGTEVGQQPQITAPGQ